MKSFQKQYWKVAWWYQLLRDRAHTFAILQANFAIFNSSLAVQKTVNKSINQAYYDKNILPLILCLYMCRALADQKTGCHFVYQYNSHFPLEIL